MGPNLLEFSDSSVSTLSVIGWVRRDCEASAGSFRRTGDFRVIKLECQASPWRPLGKACGKGCSFLGWRCSVQLSEIRLVEEACGSQFGRPAPT